MVISMIGSAGSGASSAPGARRGRPLGKARLASGVIGLAFALASGTRAASAATITVDDLTQTTATSAADGKCSLAEAITAANSDAAVDSCAAGLGADVIQLPAGAFDLLSAYSAALPNDALPQISSKLTIQGPESGTATIQRDPVAPLLRFFAVTATGNLTLKKLSFTKGVSPYSDAIGSVGTLTVDSCTFRSNGGSQDAVNYAVLDITGGTATISNSTFSANKAYSVFVQDAQATLSNDTFTANTAAPMHLRGSSVIAVSGSSFDQNVGSGGPSAIFAQLTSGTLAVSDSTFTANVTPEIGSATIYSQGGTVSLTRCTVDGNQAPYGGAVQVQGGTFTISDSTLSNNTASQVGGAIQFAAGPTSTLSVKNSTLSGNSSQGDGGAIWTDSAGSIALNNVTISNNQAAGKGGGLAIPANSSVGTVTLSNSIVAGNKNTNATPDCSTGSGKFLTSHGYNLIGSNAGCTVVAGSGDQIGTATTPIDAKLAPLANLGATFAHGLLAGSPAVDHAAPASATSPCEPKDQEGTARPIGAACDVGAIEQAPSSGGQGGTAGGSGGAAGSNDAAGAPGLAGEAGASSEGGASGSSAGSNAGRGGHGNAAGTEATAGAPDSGGSGGSGHAVKRAAPSDSGCGCRVGDSGREGSLFGLAGVALALAALRRRAQRAARRR